MFSLYLQEKQHKNNKLHLNTEIYVYKPVMLQVIFWVSTNKTLVQQLLSVNSIISTKCNLGLIVSNLTCLKFIFWTY